MPDPRPTAEPPPGRPSRRSPGRPADAALGPAIISAVLEILAEEGLGALTTAAVARRAGVSTATLYRRWPTKHELLLATARQLSTTQEVDLDTGSVRTDLHALVDHKSRLLAGRSGAALLALLGQAPEGTDLSAPLIGDLHHRTRDHLEQIRRRGLARGEDVSALDPDAGARLILGALLQAVVTRRPASRSAAGAAAGPAHRPAAPTSEELLGQADKALLLRALGCPGCGRPGPVQVDGPE
ncbi:TetR/AcrR family transcriptional regulator [Actinomyces bowdenii]|uniref:TetR/AcrR family transcriptional regulator n=1 Tax=Actinomyces bowdenii TaxID=131109 RepID=UPI00214C57CA|nr:TetR/AcrR family transcriptional regulator [Actinomyces bowdenii]MCR2051328.1 TetR/AcrR family transcriptional regulator [Actinomyces bowdenii]